MCSTAAVVRRVSCVCAAVALAAVISQASASSAEQQQSAGGLGTVLWSVLDGCLGPDSTEPTAVCLKSRALTALDRALARPTVTVAEGVSLATRAGKSLPVDLLQAEKADRAALDAAKDPDHKNALLDDLLVGRLNDFVSTRSIVLDELAGEEGRSKKKQQKSMQQAIMMAGMTAVAVLGPMAFSFVAMLAGKALLVSKIALVVSGILALKKLFQPQPKKTTHTTIEAIPHYYSGGGGGNGGSGGGGEQNVELNAHDMAYSQYSHQK
ncbi:Protein of unknown function DUF1676 [Cinara cedri]|uniref:Uncharacterized protein n=1 Tax=Cinara cedri TaxID=506608 RepID=A0A5E4N8K6_9HEMI|nr:Protein of unknown function DUF1676 [Cinara cedri]